MSVIVSTGESLSIGVYLTSSGAPLEGVTSSTLVIDQLVPSVETITGATLTEHGSGLYTLLLPSTVFDVAGIYSFALTPEGGDIQVLSANAVETAATSPSPSGPSISTTPVFGWIMDSSGSPVANSKVAVRITNLPLIISGAGVSTGLVVVTSDSSGYFSFSGIPGSKVDVSIPSIGYRRILTVPSISANLFSIP